MWSLSTPSGSRSGHIHHHDVRVANHHIFTLQGHSQEVCGLKWSPDGRYLASGGNDNLVCVWPRVQEGSASFDTQSVRTWSEHQGAVKVSGPGTHVNKNLSGNVNSCHIFSLWCFKCDLYWICCYYCRLWPGVHGSHISLHQAEVPAIATSVSGTWTAAPASVHLTLSPR